MPKSHSKRRHPYYRDIYRYRARNRVCRTGSLGFMGTYPEYQNRTGCLKGILSFFLTNAILLVVISAVVLLLT